MFSSLLASKNKKNNNNITSHSFISNKAKNNTNNKSNNNNCLTSMTCLGGCHSKVTIITAEAASVAATSLTTPSTNTIISSSAKTKIETTMKTSTSASSSSTKDNSNYMHCENSTFNMLHTCNKYGISANSSSSISNSNSNNNSDSCKNSNKTRSNSFRNCIFDMNNNLNSHIKFVIALIFFTWCDLSQAALRDVNLYIEPPAVRRSQSVTLHCHYTIEGAPLYSVKFYRGQLEFFRYTPGEYPNTKVFHYPGIKVDESVSNSTQVVIRNVNFGLSGNFSCEVTADAPLFSTAMAYAQMQVVEFPDKRPQLLTELARYEPGDVLRANCSTPPSRPRAELRFTINNIPVSTEETQYIRTVDNLIASRLNLKVQLQAVHFASAAISNDNSNLHKINGFNGGSNTGIGTITTSLGGGSSTDAGVGVVATAAASVGLTPGGGGLLLRCTAQIGDLYQEYKEIELGVPQKDPVPARVTSSGGGFRGFLETYFGPSSAATTINYKHIKSLIFIRVLIILLSYSQR